MLETLVIEKYKSIFGGRMWWDTAPEGRTAAQMQDVFCIVQEVGGVQRQYVENDLPDMTNARVQFFVWGGTRMAVNAAARQLRKAVLDSNTAIWIASPVGGMAGDYNEALKLRGSRQDFSIWYPDPLA